MSETKKMSIIDMKRASLAQVKHSVASSEARGSFSASGKSHVKTLLSTPVSAASKTRIGGQLFLCVIGTIIAVAISIWALLFSHEDRMKRLLFAGAASFCSLIFILLGIKSIRAEAPEPEELPDISQERRRSTITGRPPHKKSILHEDGPNEVLVVSDATKPLVSHH